MIDGTRTRDNRNHNPGLYQLSYDHHLLGEGENLWHRFQNSKTLFEFMSDPDSPQKPVGFKEWARVCDHLATGVTSLILRKGGIAEGRGGFDFGHTDFWLFPTFFHNEDEGLKPAFRSPRHEPRRPPPTKTAPPSPFPPG